MLTWKGDRAAVEISLHFLCSQMFSGCQWGLGWGRDKLWNNLYLIAIPCLLLTLTWLVTTEPPNEFLKNSESTPKHLLCLGYPNTDDNAKIARKREGLSGGQENQAQRAWHIQWVLHHTEFSLSFIFWRNISVPKSKGGNDLLTISWLIDVKCWA